MVTDPALAMHVLHSPHFDKFQFIYSFLDPVSRLKPDFLQSSRTD